MEGVAKGAVTKDMSSNDITKRFELLENQWLDFQQRSSTPDLDEEPIEFPSSLASFDASNNVSAVPSQAPSEGGRRNIVLPRLKPFPPKAAFEEACEDNNVAITSQPDSPLSSSSSLSTSSSSSSSSPGVLSHLDPISSRRKRLFTQPATPIKETILDSSSPKKASGFRNSHAFLSRHKKDDDADLAPAPAPAAPAAPAAAPETNQSRSPPPGLVAEELDNTLRPTSLKQSLQQRLSSSRSLLRKTSTPHATPDPAVVENGELEGKTVLRTLHSSLLQVLTQLENKEKNLGKAWKEWNENPESSRGLKHFADLDLLTSSKQTGFSGLPRIAGANSPEKWCDVVSAVCQRLVSYLEKETMLQKWAISLEKESMRVLKLEEDIVEAKVHTAEELDAARRMKKHAEDNNKVAAEERHALVKDRDALVQWVSHLQEREKFLHNELEDRLQKKEREISDREALVHKRERNIRELEQRLQKDDIESVEREDGLQRKERNLQELEERLQKKERTLGSVEERIQKKEKLQQDLKAKRRELEEAEADLAEKVIATENLSKKLVAREKALHELLSKAEQDRRQVQEASQNLQKEKKKLHVAEVENELSKKNAQEILSQASEERKKSSSALKRTEEKLKTWEETLKDKEKDLQQQETLLKELELQLVKEQERSHTMHAKLIKDQESIMAEEEDLKRKEVMLESKSIEARRELEKLNRERKQVLTECKRLTEMEARIQEAEKALEIKQHDHQLKVNKQTAEYQNRIEDLEALRVDLDGRTAELQRKFDQLQHERERFDKYKNEEEEKLLFLLEQKEGVEEQNRKLRALQRDIEHAGAEMINHIMVMDKASSKLESERQQVALAQQQLETVTGSLTAKQRSMKQREEDLAQKEERLEQQGGMLLSKRREMTKMETALKKKEEILEEQSCTLLKLEVEVKDRMRRVENLEKRTNDVEKAWEDLREEQNSLSKQREYLGSVRSQFEQLAASQKAELMSQSKEREEINRMREKLEKQRSETTQLMEALREKELKASEKESSLFELECKFLKGRTQIEKDAEELKQQLRKAHSELDAQRRYVEDRQKAVDAAVLSLKEEATKLNARKREVEEKEQALTATEERQKFLELHRKNLDRQLLPLNEKLGQLALADDGHSRNEVGVLARERESLRAQQLELEKTKQAVQEAKATLTMQLKASKKMVADASLIAEKASREREALEDERRLLSEKKKEIETSLAQREMQLTTEMKRLESMKMSLDDKLHIYSTRTPWEALKRSRPGSRAGSEKDESERPAARNFASYRALQERQRLPSQKRLETVMSSLLDARQASRSRLQRTENALAALPPSMPSTVEVRQALRSLSTRLSTMEQIEEGLASQLRDAYEAESTEEGAIVDKVELLSKMEEQQNLRAEWEKDMQRQLERISALQTHAGGYHNAMTTMESVDRALSPIMQGTPMYEQQGGGAGAEVGSSPEGFVDSYGSNLVQTDCGWNESYANAAAAVAAAARFKENDAFSVSPMMSYSNDPQSEMTTRRKLLGHYA